MNKKNGTQIQSAWEISTWCAALLVVAFPSVAAAAVEAVLYSFAGGPSDGAHQNGYAVADHAGNLDGTTQDGGTSAGGTGFTAEEPKIVTFDVPGSTCKGEFLSCTTVTAINSKGVLVGSYDDADGATHGYLRRPNGDFTTFNVPGSVCVPFAGSPTSCASPTGIDERDEITGSYSDASGLSHGFLRARGGTITSFDAPGAVNGTMPSAISAEGEVTGYFTDSNFGGHGFIRSGDGSITTFDSPDAIIATIPTAISREGEVVGYYVDANYTNHGFLRSRDGSFTTFDAPAAVYGTTPSSVGDRGEIVGTYVDSNGEHGFLRACDGVITSYDVDSLSTYIASINSNGAITGVYEPTTGTRGFFRPRGGALLTFTPPDAISTFVTAANSADVVVGSYYTKIGTGAQTQILQHGFLWIPRRDGGECESNACY